MINACEDGLRVAQANSGQNSSGGASGGSAGASGGSGLNARRANSTSTEDNTPEYSYGENPTPDGTRQDAPSILRRVSLGRGRKSGLRSKSISSPFNPVRSQHNNDRSDERIATFERFHFPTRQAKTPKPNFGRQSFNWKFPDFAWNLPGSFLIRWIQLQPHMVTECIEKVNPRFY